MKIIWIIQAYESMSEQGQIFDTVTLQIYGNSEEEAIKRAKKLVKKKFYRLSEVIEK